MLRVSLLAAALLLVGCVVKRTPAWELPAPAAGAIGDPIIAELLANGDRAFAARLEPAKADEALQAYDAALRYRPEDPRILVRAARAATSLGVRTGGARGPELLARAVAYAERALAVRNGALRTLALKDASPEAVFAAAEHQDLPALLAYAEALLAFCDRHGVQTLLAEQDRLQAAARRAVALDRRAQEGAPDRLVASIEASLPEGSLVSALEHFEAALVSGPRYLPTRLAYARRYAARLRDQPLFKRLVNEVLAADPGDVPENVLAQREARRLSR